MNKEHIKLHKVTGKTDDKFVGMKIISNSIHIFHPESYSLDIDSKSFCNDVISLFRTFSCSKRSDLEEYKTHIVSVGPTVEAFNSYIWLIRDYLIGGIPKDTVYQFKTSGSGKIDWKRTISKNEAIVSNGSVIYPDYIKKKHYEHEDLYANAYKICLKISIEYFGWLFNITNVAITDVNLKNRRKYLNFIKKRLYLAHSDLEKIRLIHMLKIIENASESESTQMIEFGVDDYHRIFESMIDFYFGNIDDITEFYPEASWHLKRLNYKPISCNPLRPDTILLDGNTAYIIDSKYYRYGSDAQPRSLPNISSIQKQISYGDYIKNNNLHDINTVYNIFLIPYNKSVTIYNDIELFQSTENIQFIGYAKTEWRDGLSSHEIIYAFLIDLKYLIKRYEKKQKGLDSKVLIQQTLESEMHCALLNE